MELNFKFYLALITLISHMWTCSLKCFSFLLRHCINCLCITIFKRGCMAKDEVLACTWVQGRGEEWKLARKISLQAPTRPTGELLVLSLIGPETRFFRVWRIKLIFRCVSPLIKPPKLIQSIRKLAHGGARKLVPTHSQAYGRS